MFKIKLISFLLLAGTTLALSAIFPQFQQSGPDMLRPDWRVSGPAGSVLHAKGGHVRLQSGNAGTSVRALQGFKAEDAPPILRLSADVQCNGVTRGEYPWNQARLLLVQKDKNNQWLGNTSRVADIYGTRSWKPYSREFDILPKTATFRVVSVLSRCTGEMEAKNIRLYPVRENPEYKWVQGAVFAAWGIFLTFFFLTLPGLFQARNAWIMTVCAGAILVGTLMPIDVKKTVYDTVLWMWQMLGGETGYYSDWIIGIAGHSCFFLLFGILTARLFPGRSLIQPVAYVVMLGMGTELIQMFIRGRQGGIRDFSVDLAAGLLGIFIARLLSRRYRRS